MSYIAQNKLNIFLCLCGFMLFSCNSEISRQLEPKGVALGKMNEIVVIADEDVWEGMWPEY